MVNNEIRDAMKDEVKFFMQAHNNHLFGHVFENPGAAETLLSELAFSCSSRTIELTLNKLREDSKLAEKIIGQG